MTPALVFLSALGLSLGLTPVVRLLALRLGVVDHPGTRKIHHVPIPLLGGVAIVVSFTTVILGVQVLAPDLLGDSLGKIYPLLSAGLIIAALGIYDDVRGARATVKLFWQTVAASVLVFGGVQNQLFTNPLGGSFHLGWLSIPITIFWVVGITNALNLIDGLDGLATGIGSIAALSMCAVGAMADNTLVAVSSLAIGGAALGFLPFNLFPARIFLGDTGSMFIGFVLASLGAVGSVKASTTTVLVLPIVVLGIPLFDTLWAVLRRTRRRVSPFKPDRDHLHHRLVRVGLHHRHVMMVLYFVCAFLGLSAAIMVQLPYQTGFLFAILLAMGGILGVWTLKYIEEHVEERLLAAASGGGNDAASAEAAANGGSARSQSRRRKSDPPGVEILICEIGRFKPGTGISPAFQKVADRIREALSRRLKIYDVGAYLSEDRELLLVLRLQPLGPEGRELVRKALIGLFSDEADRWGDGAGFPVFQWKALSDEKVRSRLRVPGAAVL